jgi:hypothetical protein
MNQPIRTIARVALALLAALTSGLCMNASHPAPAAAAGGGSRLGVVADVGTRYGIYGRQGGPIGAVAGTSTKWVKEEFRWDWVEPSRDRWTWAFMDEAVDDERAKGMDILGLLDYTAGWAVGQSAPVSTAVPPADLWTNYVTQTVNRYKDRVHVWEVWNEPNMPVFWAGSKEDFANLQRLTYDTIKRADPGATVLGPTITGVDEDWLNAMPWDKFDVLGLHMYVPPASLNDQGYSYYDQGLPNLQRIVQQHGGKPVWITEFGYSSGGGGEPWHVGDEGLQARYLAQEAAETLAYTGVDIQKMFVYDFNDDTPGGGFGLTRHDWSSQKPAYAAYRTMIAHLDTATGQGKINAGPGILAFRFTRDGKQVDVVWAPNGGTAVIPTGSDADVFDLGGNHRTIGQANGALRFDVGADPLYVEHTPASAPVNETTGASVPGAGVQVFAETGKTARGVFLDYWNAHGGLAIYGFPISDLLTETLEDGKPYTVQYFERARFEWHPENQPPYQVLLGQFGRHFHPADPAVDPAPGATYFGQTGHNLSGVFLAYRQGHGGVAQFGYPLTEPFQEQLEDGSTYTVQYFERARFEYHPENTPPYDVLLGQFGRRVYAELGH